LKDASNRQIIESSEEEFKDLVHSLAKSTSRELGKKLNGIYFRTMKTKWASCSSKRNLTVNLLMRQLPENLLRYVIFHEIAHLKDKRHNDQFWKMVASRFHNYQDLERELFVYWFQIANKKGRF
jgi:predicted metal-dependent hydrolase